MLYKLIYGIALAGIPVRVLLGAILVSKGMWRPYPLFTAYTLFSLVQTAVEYPLRGNPHLYLYVYCFCQTIGFILGLGVIYEVFTTLLTPYPALTKVASRAFLSTIVVLLLTAGAVIYFHAPVQGSRLAAGFVVLEQATRIAQVGLIVFLFSFSSIFGLHWRQYIFGMALGLGVFVTVELAGITLRSHFGTAASPVLAVARSLAFSCSVLIWLGYLLVPERVASTSEIPQRAQLEQWNQAIMELINQ